MKLLLTDRFCARATARSAQTDFFDETVHGLALRVGAKRKTWTLHLTVAGKRLPGSALAPTQRFRSVPPELAH